MLKWHYTNPLKYVWNMEYNVSMNEWMQNIHLDVLPPKQSITTRYTLDNTHRPLRTVPPAAGSQLTQALAPVLLLARPARTPPPDTEETETPRGAVTDYNTRAGTAVIRTQAGGKWIYT